MLPGKKIATTRNEREYIRGYEMEQTIKIILVHIREDKRIKITKVKIESSTTTRQKNWTELSNNSPYKCIQKPYSG